ncbi:hypothetical protein ACA910_014067 [Epithemia clementina (nom. ined.)]
MKFGFAIATIVSSWAALSSNAFVPLVATQNKNNVLSKCDNRAKPVFSTVETETQVDVQVPSSSDAAENGAVDDGGYANGVAAKSIPTLNGAEIKEKLERQLAKLREKDSKSPKLSKEDIKVVYEDDDIIVVEKPSGVLCVPGRDGFPNLAESVCEAFGCQMGRADMMVVHRLGMDTSGLVVFARSMEALRGMNTIFRSRQIERKYEALVCGHVEKDEGLINLPLMRDYEFPPYMRISTDDHQRALADLSPADVGKKLLEAPKKSLTRYEVMAREEYLGHPVTRLSLTSISGRTHQLNVHLAALGHPIVGDRTYGIHGEAAVNGGLTDDELETMVANPSRADAALQQKLADASKGGPACIHAKSLKFRHPVTKEDISLSTNAPF